MLLLSALATASLTDYLQAPPRPSAFVDKVRETQGRLGQLYPLGLGQVLTHFDRHERVFPFHLTSSLNDTERLCQSGIPVEGLRVQQLAELCLFLLECRFGSLELQAVTLERPFYPCFLVIRDSESSDKCSVSPPCGAKCGHAVQAIAQNQELFSPGVILRDSGLINCATASSAPLLCVRGQSQTTQGD
jgi:hypothetical protein